MSDTTPRADSAEPKIDPLSTTAPAPKLKPAEATIERLAAERAKRDGIGHAEAYAKVLSERPEL